MLCAVLRRVRKRRRPRTNYKMNILFFLEDGFVISLGHDGRERDVELIVHMRLLLGSDTRRLMI